MTIQGDRRTIQNDRQTVIIYKPNALNQYDAIDNPTRRVVRGEAVGDPTVTVNNQPTTRQGNGFAAFIEGNNHAGPGWTPVTTRAIKVGAGANGANLVSTSKGNLYFPPAHEVPGYDYDGNLLSDGRWTYTWDGENRLTAMQTNPRAIAAGIPLARAEYSYDGDSRRISRSQRNWDAGSQAFIADPAPTRFLWKDWTLLAELKATGGQLALSRSYAWGLDPQDTLTATGNVGNLLAIIDSEGTQPVALLPAYDGNGNIIILADSAGQAAISYDYDAFGNQVLAINHAARTNPIGPVAKAAARNAWGFSTKQVDPLTTFSYYGYRYYDAVTGRLPSRDPIEEQGGNNVYGFVGNNGASQIDLHGQIPLDTIWTSSMLYTILL